jgi:hypothetical protein
LSVYDDAKKALQDFLAPELEEIKGEMKAINIRLDAMEKLSEARFAAIMRELAIDKRLERLERDSTEKRPS